jgi:nucleoside-diphosphate-sugar epimerase
MRVLIVGCGYVGLPLGAALALQGHEVYGMRRSDTGVNEMRAAGIQPMIGDITRPKTLATEPPSFDWVVNCVSAGASDDAAYRLVYLEGMHHLLSWLGARPPLRLVYTSSTGVYGQTDGSWVTETSATEPEAETARVLLAAEQVLLDTSPNNQVPGVVLRVAGIYGPGRGYWLRQFLGGQARLEGRGERVLNMIHRQDVAGAVIAALQRGRPGQIYNAVDDQPVTQLELFQWLSEHLKQPMPASVAEPTGAGRARGLTSKRISNQKLKTELGFRFKYPTFREGFAALGGAEK